MLFLVEDKRFSIHLGFDPIAVIRAAIFNVQKKSLQGASTIPQQIVSARIPRPIRISRSWKYKALQTALAFVHCISRSKVSLLHEYVNTIYWGRSYHGLDSAATGYFGCDRQSLSVTQSFFLAERIAAPNRMSAKRILNLVNRKPIKAGLARHGATVANVFEVYSRIYGNGGGLCQLRER